MRHQMSLLDLMAAIAHLSPPLFRHIAVARRSLIAVALANVNYICSVRSEAIESAVGKISTAQLLLLQPNLT